jgi:hypothetical protein
MSFKLEVKERSRVGKRKKNPAIVKLTVFTLQIPY